MADIFQEAGLPLWLRPYEVLVTSSYTALIETIPDTVILYTCSLTELLTSKFHYLFNNVLLLFYRLHFILSKVDIPTSQACDTSLLPSIKKILQLLNLPR